MLKHGVSLLGHHGSNFTLRLGELCPRHMTYTGMRKMQMVCLYEGGLQDCCASFDNKEQGRY